MASAVLVTAVIAQSKYSGIYSGSVSSGQRFLAATTMGGRALGLDSSSEGLRDALNPAKSTISSTGKLKGVTPAGSVITATVGSTYKISGTVKVSGETFRLSGRRIYK